MHRHGIRYMFIQAAIIAWSPRFPEVIPTAYQATEGYVFPQFQKGGK